MESCNESRLTEETLLFSEKRQTHDQLLTISAAKKRETVVCKVWREGTLCGKSRGKKNISK